VAFRQQPLLRCGLHRKETAAGKVLHDHGRDT
jgi:hypothetical protein